MRKIFNLLFAMSTLFLALNTTATEGFKDTKWGDSLKTVSKKLKKGESYCDNANTRKYADYLKSKQFFKGISIQGSSACSSRTLGAIGSSDYIIKNCFIENYVKIKSFQEGCGFFYKDSLFAFFQNFINDEVDAERLSENLNEKYGPIATFDNPESPMDMIYGWDYQDSGIFFDVNIKQVFYYSKKQSQKVNSDFDTKYEKALVKAKKDLEIKKKKEKSLL